MKNILNISVGLITVVLGLAALLFIPYYIGLGTFALIDYINGNEIVLDGEPFWAWFGGASCLCLIGVIYVLLMMHGKIGKGVIKIIKEKFG
jgi:hypothetical protein